MFCIVLLKIECWKQQKTKQAQIYRVKVFAVQMNGLEIENYNFYLIFEALCFWFFLLLKYDILAAMCVDKLNIQSNFLCTEANSACENNECKIQFANDASDCGIWQSLTADWTMKC